MKRLMVGLVGVGILAAVASSCSNESGTVTAPLSFEVVAPTSAVFLGSQVTIALTGDVGTVMVTGSRVDFEGDGTFDDTATHATVVHNYTHVYPAAGAYTATVQLLSGTQLVEERAVNITVTDMPVSLGVPQVITSDVVTEVGCTAYSSQPWSLQVENVPMDSSITDIPETRITLSGIRVSYTWASPSLNIPDLVSTVSLGPISIGSTSMLSVTSIDTGFLTAGHQGQTANTVITLSGTTGGGEAIETTLQETLTVQACSPLAAPTNLSASASGVSTATITWSGGSTDFELDRRVGSGAWTNVYTGTNTSFNDSGLGSNTTYQYRVRASAGVQMSNYSATASTTTNVSFPNDVFPIFSRAPGSCTNCHRDSSNTVCPANGGLNLEDGDNSAAVFGNLKNEGPCDTSAGADRIEPPAMALQSLALRKPTQSGVTHGGGTRWLTSDADYQLLRLWIQQGAGAD